MRLFLNIRRGPDAWTEEHEVDANSALSWALAYVEDRNLSRSVWEPGKWTLEGVEVVDARPMSKHKWVLAREINDGDDSAYRCLVCGITGYKRPGERVRRDPKYRHSTYERCDEALEAMKGKG